MDKGIIYLYSSSYCISNSRGAGGWAYKLVFPNLSTMGGVGSDGYTTINIMSLWSCIKPLQFIAEDPDMSRHQVHIVTDSHYVFRGITEWIDNWEQNGYLNSYKEPIKNRSFWKILRALDNRLDTHWTMPRRGEVARAMDFVRGIAFDQAVEASKSKQAK